MTVREPFLSVVHALDYPAIENARSAVQPADVPALAAWYQELPDWDRKVALATLLMDQSGPAVEAVMLDVLRAPGTGDVVDLIKATALGILDEQHDTFMVFYNDRALLRRTVEEVLAEHGKVVEAGPPDPAPPPLGANEDSPLMAALMNGDRTTALRLLEEGADPDQARLANQSALYWAAAMNLVDVIDALIERGANVDAADIHGGTPLGQAASNGHLDAARQLVAAGADVTHAYGDGRTVLMFAIRGGNVDLMELLLEHGADAHQPQPNFTPLAFACFEGTPAMVGRLLERGVAPNVPVRGGRFGGRTPLMFAANAGRVSVVRGLLAAGADPTATDGNGRVARDFATSGRAGRVRDLLDAKPSTPS